MSRLLSYIANFLILVGLCLLIWIMSNDLSENYLRWYHLTPYILILVLFGYNFSQNHKVVLDDLYYNLALLFSSIYLHIVIFRTVFDETMVVKNFFSSRLNLIYLSNNLTPLTIMFFLLIGINLFLIYFTEKAKPRD